MNDGVQMDLQELYKALGLLLCTTPILFKEFSKNLKVHTVQTAKNLNPNAKNIELSNITGIDRNLISDLLEEKIIYQEKSKLMILLSDLWKSKDKNGQVTWKQFYAMATKTLSTSLSPTSALKLLKDSDSVSQSNKGELITVNTSRLTVSRDILISTGIFSLSIHRHIHTSLLNIVSSEGLFQQDLRSSQIPPSKQTMCHEELYELLDKVIWPMVLKILEKYEAKVPPGTYPDCGLSAFEFFSNKKV